MIWTRFPLLGVAYGVSGGRLPVVRCRVVTKGRATTVGYLDAPTEQLTDLQEGGLHSEETVLQESLAAMRLSSLEKQWDRDRLELFPREDVDEDVGQKMVKGQRQRRAMRLKEKETHDEEDSVQNALIESGEGKGLLDEQSLLEQKTLIELENGLLATDFGKERLGNTNEFRFLPVLTKEQEVILGTMIQRAKPVIEKNQALKAKHKATPSQKTLAAACNLQLKEMQKILKDAERAKSLMMQHNMRLVYYCARPLKDRVSEDHFGDLIMEGAGPKGLERAVMGFDPKRGRRFSTYGLLWIRQSMVRSIDKDLRTVPFPDGARQAVAKIYKTMDRLFMGYTDNPAEVAAVAKELKIPLKKVQKYLKLAKRPISLERSMSKSRKGEELEPLIDSVPDPRANVEEAFRKQRIQELVDAALTILEPKEREVLELRYGLDGDGRPMTRGEVAKMYGVSTERVRQIETRGKLCLRKMWKQAFLDAHLFKA